MSAWFTFKKRYPLFEELLTKLHDCISDYDKRSLVGKKETFAFFQVHDVFFSAVHPTIDLKNASDADATLWLENATNTLRHLFSILQTLRWIADVRAHFEPRYGDEAFWKTLCETSS